MDEIVKIISSVGFPIALTIYLLVRFENKIDDLTKAIQDLTGQLKIRIV